MSRRRTGIYSCASTRSPLSFALRPLRKQDLMMAQPTDRPFDDYDVNQVVALLERMSDFRTADARARYLLRSQWFRGRVQYPCASCPVIAARRLDGSTASLGIDTHELFPQDGIRRRRPANPT